MCGLANKRTHSTCTLAYTSTYTHVHTHMCIHTYMHAHIHTYTHTHKHTHPGLDGARGPQPPSYYEALQKREEKRWLEVRGGMCVCDVCVGDVGDVGDVGGGSRVICVRGRGWSV